MTRQWNNERDGPAAATLPGAEQEVPGQRVGESITIGNEFAEIRVCKVETRNGSRLLIESPKSSQWIALCPLELEALTWQTPQTFSAMIGNPQAPLITDEP